MTDVDDMPERMRRAHDAARSLLPTGVHVLLIGFDQRVACVNESTTVSILSTDSMRVVLLDVLVNLLTRPEPFSPLVRESLDKLYQTLVKRMLDGEPL